LHYSSIKLKEWDWITISEESFTDTAKSYSPADTACFAIPTRSCLG